MKKLLTLTSIMIALAGAAPSRAASFSANFDDGQTPAGTALHGTAVIQTTGGVNNGGALKLTLNQNDQNGSFIIEDLDAGTPVYGFTASMAVRLGGGTAPPADGWSFNFANDLPDGTFSPAEEGAGTGLTIAFDVWDSGGGEAPAIDIKVGGAVVKSTLVPLSRLTTGANYTNVNIRLKNDGSLSLDYGGEVIYTNYFLPGYQPVTGGRFGLAARTGGANQTHFVDNLQITTVLTPAIGFTVQPKSIKAVQGRSANFVVQVSNAGNATYQWLRNGTPITGATNSSYTIANTAAADQGAKFKVQVTSGALTITSDEATLTVVDIPLPAAEKTFDFNDGLTPAGTTLGGANAVIDAGVLKLTVAENSQSGYFYVADFDNGAPVYGFTAVMDALIGGGSRPPADGWSLNYGSDIPDDFGGAEEGAGTGLTIAFDIFDNGGGEAPTIDVKYGGRVIASSKLTIADVETGDQFGDTIVRLQNDGTVDVVFKGNVIHENVQTPFVSLSGARFAMGARTGGLNENHWFDNIRLTTENTPGPFRIITPPAKVTTAVGSPASFSVSVSDTNGATYQWLRNGTPISGATSSTYTIASTTTADAGARISVQATKGGSTVTSPEVLLKVIDVPANPKININFNDGAVPAGTAIFGNAKVVPSGGVGDTGYLSITDALNSQSGAFVIRPIEGGAEVDGLTAAFDLQLSGGAPRPADGFSFNFGADILEGTVGGAEEGSGTGLIVAFDVWDSGGGEAPAIDIKNKGVTLASVKMSIPEIQTADSFAPVIVRITPDGTLDVAFQNRVIYDGFKVTNWTAIANGKFGFYARTGGANENHWIDNIRINTTKPAGPTRFTQNPAGQLVVVGGTATFSAAVNDPVGVTYQWLKNGAAITGATNATYTTGAVALSDNGAKFSLRATGPGGTATSAEATLEVIQLPTPEIDFNFNNNLTPQGALDPLGSARIEEGVLKLTDAANSQNGGFVLPDFKGGAPVPGLTVTWKMLVGGGTETPADGFSFNFGSDVPTTGDVGEEGAGNGLVVVFDTFDNAGGEAPAIDLKWQGEVVASKKVPISLLRTGTEWADVVVRLEPNGTVDVVYKGTTVHHNVQLPNYSPVSGGIFRWGARTGGLNDNHWVDDIKIATGSDLPRITSVTRSGSNVVINWTGGGTLESAPAVTGPWSPIAGSTSPATVPASQPMQFFRVRK